VRGLSMAVVVAVLEEEEGRSAGEVVAGVSTGRWRSIMMG
jgi:hypothetical protein